MEATLTIPTINENSTNLSLVNTNDNSLPSSLSDRVKDLTQEASRRFDAFCGAISQVKAQKYLLDVIEKIITLVGMRTELSGSTRQYMDYSAASRTIIGLSTPLTVVQYFKDFRKKAGKGEATWKQAAGMVLVAALSILSTLKFVEDKCSLKTLGYVNVALKIGNVSFAKWVFPGLGFFISSFNLAHEKAMWDHREAEIEKGTLYEQMWKARREAWNAYENSEGDKEQKWKALPNAGAEQYEKLKKLEESKKQKTATPPPTPSSSSGQSEQINTKANELAVWHALVNKKHQPEDKRRIIKRDLSNKDLNKVAAAHMARLATRQTLGTKEFRQIQEMKLEVAEPQLIRDQLTYCSNKWDTKLSNLDIAKTRAVFAIAANIGEIAVSILLLVGLFIGIAALASTNFIPVALGLIVVGLGFYRVYYDSLNSPTAFNEDEIDILPELVSIA